MQSGKLILTKGFTDAYPEVLPKITGYWYTHSDQYGRYFIYHSYADAEKEMTRLHDMLGGLFTRGMYVEPM